MLEENENAIKDAIKKDLGRDAGNEFSLAMEEIDTLLKHFQEWGAPKKVKKPADLESDDELVIKPEPLGVVLVISPWNFPLHTSMPCASALAGGNTVILKLSEISPTFSSTFASLVAKYFNNKLFAAVEGEVKEVKALLDEKFDHIMYTGNPTIAREIMAAAAKNLTPVTLELGGKK
ncbi:hypothetical protein OESDEN_10241 [Oesophagostomum dentatum]|uniref:Aldehyde dehydrogenase domain-containing protein n=1 Tax=Oesophagostomum dentatum TaxID=61180 RepID=A0A0B1T3D7_OESDE|nr:hypothetical protein OESDEN_10241 [Oesophagostomum dentatum]